MDSDGDACWGQFRIALRWGGKVGWTLRSMLSRGKIRVASGWLDVGQTLRGMLITLK